ncbi:sodium:solute symporter family protein [Bhargavaea massiliensis]|uniref:sodium:solute symporter family protein n=1 Tax=Bhargavaea massiliensis TaxID=2697500 RepID=UPI001BCE14E2|nr:sodium:solute symporter family protein [Bhargavaea massiliensis]
MNGLIIGLIAIAYIAVLFYFIIKGNKKSDDLDDFTIGGWSMSLSVSIFYFTATWVSAASVLGVPGILYANGFAGITGWFAGWFFATAILPLIAYKLRRPMFPVRTIPEYMRLRFEPYVKKSFIQAWSSVMIIIGYISYVTIQITGIGYLLSQVTGLSYFVSILIFLVFILLTVLGGVWSVAMTDVLNTIVIIFGLVLAAGLILYQVGGPTALFTQLQQVNTPVLHGGTPVEPGSMFSPLGTFSLAAMIGIFISNSLGAAVAPHWPTRLLSAKNVKTAISTPLISTLILTFVFLCLLIMGLGGRILVPTMPEGMASDQIMPLLITEFMNPVVAGILIAAIFAAALSTSNGMVLQAAIAVSYDMYRNLRTKPVADGTLIRITQVLLIVISIIAFFFSIKPPAFIAMVAAYVFGFFGSAFIGPIFLGLYSKRANRQSAYAGSMIGAVSYVLFTYLTITGLLVLPIPAIAIAMGLSVAAMLICMAIFPPAPQVAWEPYFEEDISDETKRVVDLAMRRV